MAASEVSLANRALQILGVSQGIESMTEDSANARSMARVYEPSRQALLRKYRWGFAIRRASVAADGTQTTFGSLNRYAFPNYCLRILRDKDQPDYRKDWIIEGQFIVTSESSPLEFRYIIDVTDPTQFDVLFNEVLSHVMALGSCKEITGNDNLRGQIKVDMKELLAEAKQIGSMEEDPQTAEDDDWILSRY